MSTYHNRLAFFCVACVLCIYVLFFKTTNIDIQERALCSTDSQCICNDQFALSISKRLQEAYPDKTPKLHVDEECAYIIQFDENSNEWIVYNLTCLRNSNKKITHKNAIG